MLRQILLKFKESLFAVLPIYLLVMILSFTPFIDLTIYEMIVFTLSTIFLIIGMALFNLGADIAMTPMGKSLGAGLTKQGKIIILIVVGFILGFLVTIAEPDLSVLANQTKEVFSSTTLIISIGIGVATFLALAILKTIFKVALNNLLMYFYMLLFATTLIVYMTGNESIIPLAFDSGGVTTGPITVPFLMALGLGVSSVVSRKSDKDASFGLIAMCSVGPIIVTLLLSIFSKGELQYALPDYTINSNFFITFCMCLLERMLDVVLAIGLIVLCFLICNFIFLKTPKKKLKQMAIGIIYTYFGLVLFLASVDSTFLAIGYKIGTQIAQQSKIFIIIVGFIIGALTVLAEPAVHVLNEQVQDITSGLVKKKPLMISLVVGVGIAIALAMIRVIYKFSIIYYLLPGYIICLGLTFFVPKIYSAIAFDSGGVASGPLSSSFILPLLIGVCYTLNGEEHILTEAFGAVALIAMTPLITIECLGLIAIIKDKIRSRNNLKKAIKNNDDKVIIEFM